MKFENYYLDLEKVNSLSTNDERDRIHSYYMDMMHCFSENRKEMAISIFNTLINGEYLKEIRSEKIDKILS
jgi:hypothetical protein